MSIFIDTNVLPRSFRLTDGDLELLKAIADELGEQLAISVVVWEESVAQCEREARRAFENLDAAVRSARTFHALTSPSHPSPEAVAAKWRDELATAFHIEPLDPADAQEALRREAWRTPPTREAGKQKYGIGARDAALWLTAKRRHLATDGARTFLSRRTRATSPTNLLRSCGHHWPLSLDHRSQRFITAAPPRRSSNVPVNRLLHLRTSCC